MKEIIEAFSTRIKSPLFGYSFIAFFVINWKAIFYLFFAKAAILERFQFIENNTSTFSLFIYPVGFAVLGAIVYPWINYIFVNFSKKPTELRNIIQAQSEHTLLSKKQELENIRTSLLANKEVELIERAQRDSKLETIQDLETKEKLKTEIEQLRKEKDKKNQTTFNFSDISPDSKKYVGQQEMHKMLSKYADSLGNMAELSKAVGKFQEAEKYSKEELTIRSRLLDDE